MYNIKIYIYLWKSLRGSEITKKQCKTDSLKSDYFFHPNESFLPFHILTILVFLKLTVAIRTFPTYSLDD